MFIHGILQLNSSTDWIQPFFNFTLNSLLIINLAVRCVLRAAANKELRTPAMRNYPMAFALYPKKYILIILFPAYSSVLSLSTAKIQSIDDNIKIRFIFEFFYFNHLLLTQVSIKTNNVDCFCLLFRRWFLPGSSKFIFLQWDYFFKHSKIKKPVSKPTQIQRTHFLYCNLRSSKIPHPNTLLCLLTSFGYKIFALLHVFVKKV